MNGQNFGHPTTLTSTKDVVDRRDVGYIQSWIDHSLVLEWKRMVIAHIERRKRERLIYQERLSWTNEQLNHHLFGVKP